MHLQGAEREVRVPEELSRFAALPMRVQYAAVGSDGGPAAAVSSVLCFVEAAAAAGGAAVTRWRLADVRANRTAGKGRPLNKKQRESIVEIEVAAITKVNLHVDM